MISGALIALFYAIVAILGGMSAFCFVLGIKAAQ